MGVAVMNRAVEGGLTEVTCDERPGEGEGSHVAVLGRVLPRGRCSKCKVLRPRQASRLPGTT